LEQLQQTGHFKLKYQQPFFNEFCVCYDGDVDALLSECADAGYMAGVKLDQHTIMLAVTEQRSKEDIDELVETIQQIREDAA
jgi:glycine dehydrogenase subunit 1